MRQARQKVPRLSIVSPAPTRAGHEPGSTDSLKDFFSGWLHSVAPQLSREESPKNAAHRFEYHSPPVTLTDMVRVNRATVRESTDHRHWPPEVVAQFLTADIITRKNKRS
jgi:hypothetical protein